MPVVTGYVTINRKKDFPYNPILMVMPSYIGVGHQTVLSKKKGGKLKSQQYPLTTWGKIKLLYFLHTV